MNKLIVVTFFFIWTCLPKEKNEKGIFKWSLLKKIGEANFDVEVNADYIRQTIIKIII